MQKIIHYFYDDVDIWKKGKNPSFRICYASWKRLCPDYQIKCWHDKMPEFQQMLKDSRFLRECYKRKMWALVADYVRHYALYHYGGIYLDTDVQLLQNFDEYLDKPFFVSVEGNIYYGDNIPESAVMGGEKGHIIFKKSLDLYNSDDIFKIDYFIDPILLGIHLKNISNFRQIPYKQEVFEKAQKYYDKSVKINNVEDIDVYKSQLIYEDKDNGIYIYPSEYFCPAWESLGEKAFTPNTVCIHWNQSSWWGKSENKAFIEISSYRYKSQLKRWLYKKNDKIAKFLTFYIKPKERRQRLRNDIIESITRFLDK